MDTQAKSIEQLTDYLAGLSRPVSHDLAPRVQRAVLEREARRVVGRLDAFEQGELGWLGLAEAWEVIDLAREATSVARLACSLRWDRLRQLDEAGAALAIEVLGKWVKDSPTEPQASLDLLFENELDLINDPAVLELALTARHQGWRVRAGAAGRGSELLRVEIHSDRDEDVSMETVDSGEAITSKIHFRPIGEAGQGAADRDDEEQRSRLLSVNEITGRSDSEGPSPASTSGLSVSDLFGENIMLRDIEPRSPSLDGIESFRAELGWDSIYAPRKNEPEYARALLRIMSSDGEPPKQIVYVGDTLLNDGGAIRGLQAAGPPGRVWGFLCGATKANPDADFDLDRIYFGARWSSLHSFVGRALSEGLVFDQGTWVLFDLDQTVYAAKGRDDEPLVRARWDAVRAYLEEIVPEYKLDPERAEALYRRFDQDEYHPVTRDNMDYVVLLVLAVASGLADAAEISEYASSSRPSIAALAEVLCRRASIRAKHENIPAVLDAVKAVYYNTRAGDQTPCKDFRRHECLTMAARMRGDLGADGDDRILLNREVVDLIGHVQRTDAHLFAVSDRPLEAGVVEPDDSELPKTDLMTVPMGIRGSAIPAWGP